MRPWIVATALSLACALAATWPAASDPTQSILCNYVHPDCLSNHWLMVWVAEQALSGGSLLHNDRYYWPVGDAPWLAGNGSEGFAYAPWHVLFGWPLGSNVHLVLLLVLNGLSATALARASGASPWASVSAAPAGALLVFALHEMGAGRFSQVSVCWLGFFLAAWASFLARGGWGRAVGAAVLLALSALFYWYFAFFGVMAGAIMAAVRYATPRHWEPAPRPRWRELAAFAVLFLALVGPLLWVFLANWQAIPGTDEARFPHPEAAADSTWPGLPFLAVGGRHAGRALPFTVCALAALGLWRRNARGAGIALGLVALWFMGLMAGALVPNGPYEWVYGLAGPLRRFWWPYRHVVVFNLALIALAARGLDTLGGGRWWIAIPLGLSVPLQLDAQHAAWRAQFSRAEVPVPFYEELGAQPGEIILEPPLAPQIASAQSQLIYQFDHHKTLLGGHAMWVARVRPPAWDAMIDGNSFLSALRALETARLDGPLRFDGADLRWLIDQGVSHLVVNKEFFPLSMNGLTDAYYALGEGLFGEPVVRGTRARAWELARWNGKTEIELPPWSWPEGIQPGGPTLSIQTFRAPSMAFSIPIPPDAPPPPRPR